MPRKKRNKPPAAAIVAPVVQTDASEAHRMLINQLSIKDARHLMNTQGELDSSQLVIELVKIVVVAGSCAYAIGVGKATAWHLLLPMLAEYFALNIGVAVAYVIVRHKDLRTDALKALGNILAWPTLFAISAAARAFWNSPAGQSTTFQVQVASDLQATWNWISDYHMQWPMLAAAVSVFLDLPYRVKNLLVYGPPFVSVSLGCALRATIPFMAFFLLPIVFSSTAVGNAWILWGLILFAETVALYVHWDVQRRLRKLDGASGGEGLVKN